jgi:hypothetical protein
MNPRITLGVIAICLLAFIYFASLKSSRAMHELSSHRLTLGQFDHAPGSIRFVERLPGVSFIKRGTIDEPGSVRLEVCWPVWVGLLALSSAMTLAFRKMTV